MKLNRFDEADIHTKLDAKTKDELINKYALGASYKELIDEFGCSEYTIRAILKQAGLTRTRFSYLVFLNAFVQIEGPRYRGNEFRFRKFEYAPHKFIKAATGPEICRFIKNSTNFLPLAQDGVYLYMKSINENFLIEEYVQDWFETGTDRSNNPTKDITVTNNRLFTIVRVKDTEDYTDIIDKYVQPVTSVNFKDVALSIIEVTKTIHVTTPNHVLEACYTLLHSNSSNHNSNEFDVEKIAFSLYDNRGQIKDANFTTDTDEGQSVPYEAIHELDNSQISKSVKETFQLYGNRVLLYGFCNDENKVVYVGVTASATARGIQYQEDIERFELTGNGRPVVVALSDNRIKSVIIFKSNFPKSNNVETTLLRKLENYFSIELFKTFPYQEPDALNFLRPGAQSSGKQSRINKLKLDLILDDSSNILSIEDYKKIVTNTLNVGWEFAKQRGYSYRSYIQRLTSSYLENPPFEKIKLRKLYQYCSVANRSLYLFYEFFNNLKTDKEKKDFLTLLFDKKIDEYHFCRYAENYGNISESIYEQLNRIDDDASLSVSE